MQLDFLSVLQTLLALLAGTGGTYICTEIIKRAKSIPWIAQGDTTKLRLVATVLSGVAATILAVTDPAFSPETLQGLLVSGGAWLSMLVGSHSIHKTISSTSDNETKE